MDLTLNTGLIGLLMSKPPSHLEISSRFQEIESIKFYLEQNAASTVAGFRRGLLANAAYRRLISDLQLGDVLSSEVVTRLSELALKQVDPNFENPNDVALAAYLSALVDVDSPEISSGIAAVQSAKSTWWSLKISNEALRQVVDTSAYQPAEMVPVEFNYVRQATDVVPANFYVDDYSREAQALYGIKLVGGLPQEYFAALQFAYERGVLDERGRHIVNQAQQAVSLDWSANQSVLVATRGSDQERQTRGRDLYDLAGEPNPGQSGQWQGNSSLLPPWMIGQLS